MQLTVARSDRQVVDARDATLHEAAIVELPVLIAVRAIPTARVVVPFISEANGNAVALTSPKLLHEPIVELLRPLARQELPYRFAADQELGPVAPNAVRRIGERDALRIARVPGVLGHAHLLGRSLA